MGGGSSKQKEVAPGPQPAERRKARPWGQAPRWTKGRERGQGAPETGIDDEADDKPADVLPRRDSRATDRYINLMSRTRQSRASS